MAGAKPALRSTLGVTRRSAKGVTTRNIGPVELNASDDAGTFSMTYKVEQFDNIGPGVFVLNQTRTGDAFIFGEGLGLFLDRAFLTFQTQEGIKPLFSDRTSAAVVTDTAGINLNDYIIAGQTFVNTVDRVSAAVGTNPYTKDCIVKGGLNDLYTPTGLSNGTVLEGTLIFGEHGAGTPKGINRLIAFFDFASSLTHQPGGTDGLFYRTEMVPKFVL